MIRELRPEDLAKLRLIHEKHYKEEFDFPDFFQGFLCGFVVEDEKGIITAGGLKLSLEAILVTNKERKVRERVKALYQILDCSKFIALEHKFDQISCTIQDENYENQLKQVGFQKTIGTSLTLCL